MSDTIRTGKHLRLVPSQPAAEFHATPDATPAPNEREMIIDVRPDDWAQFIGTAAQLIGEGLIPTDFEWPRAADCKRWNANGFNYELRRTRPEGHKGPMRSWLELDNWFIRIMVTGRDYHWHTRQQLARKTEELAAAYHRHTAAGQREWDANYRRYRYACSDQAFQAFKSIFIPPRKKPGRKPTAAG